MTGIERAFARGRRPTTRALNATVVFHYDESELNGITESTLALYALVPGAVWTGHSRPPGRNANTLTASGIASLAGLTAGKNESSAVGDGLLPVRTGFVSLYPNPFNPMTRIVFDLEKTGPAQVGVYDMQGSEGSYARLKRHAGRPAQSDLERIG